MNENTYAYSLDILIEKIYNNKWEIEKRYPP